MNIEHAAENRWRFHSNVPSNFSKSVCA